METRLDGKVALVTGGSRGIGLETAAEMLRSGIEGVVITSRKAENLEEAVRRLVVGGADSEQVRAIAARADVDEDAERAVAETIEHFGACDILVNNAGTNPSAGALMEVDLGALDKTWAVNQRAPLVWARQVWHQWMKDHGGVIINVASVGGLRPSPLIGAYNISKAALVFMTHQLAFELAPTVRVNAVAPAVVKTRLSEMLWQHDEAAAAATHPLNRLGEPEDVAQAIAYLASDAARWITGVVLPIDGGVIGASGGLA
ncbi:MAG: SDR family oxidoreductase [Acidimicrobiia bacterium]|nr:SDR family oxidoreductase [Acidimicrobiia bacterium]